MAALATHPLGTLLPRPADWQRSPAESVRRALLEGIEKLRPADPSLPPVAPEWRPYQIMYERYVLGTSLPDLEAKLLLSARQTRREHSRGMQALVAVLWEQIAPPPGVASGAGPEATSAIRSVASGRLPAEEAGGAGWPGESRATGPDADGGGEERLQREALDVGDLLRRVAGLIEARARAEDARIVFDVPPDLPPVLADRMILRQVIVHLLNYALSMRAAGDIQLKAGTGAGNVWLQVEFEIDHESPLLSEQEAGHLGVALRWVQLMDGRLEQSLVAEAQHGGGSLLLTLPSAAQPVLMVVDDHEPAVRLFRRYLGGSEVRVVGVTQATEVLPQARQVQPQAIVLDVMMPGMDGWETLQALKADPDMRAIPIVICSVWDEPEMAYALGASGYLKKPFTQEELMAVLARIGLVRNGDAAPPTVS
jgi:CheY-like chemotaxis protein